MTAETDTKINDRWQLIDIISSGDGQEWPDLFENPVQRQIAETMYGKQADAVLGSSWFAELVAVRQENEQLRAVQERCDGYIEDPSHPGTCGPCGFELGDHELSRVEAENVELRRQFNTAKDQRDALSADLRVVREQLAAIREVVEMFCSKYPTSQEFWVRKFRTALGAAAVLPEPATTEETNER